MEIKRVPGVDIANNEIDLSAVVLTGISGKIYKPTTRMAAGRLAAWEAMWLKAQHRMPPNKIFKSLVELREHLKKTDIYEASLITGKLLDPVAAIADGLNDPMLELVCCYLNTDDEDVSLLDQETVDAKLADLRYYDSEDLFILAGALTPALLKDYAENKINFFDIMTKVKETQISQLVEEAKKEKSQK